MRPHGKFNLAGKLILLLEEMCNEVLNSMNANSFSELRFTNIPIINLRMEFNSTYEYVFSTAAADALKPPIHPVEAPMFVWLGMPDDLMTLLLQRAILGVEAYLPAALKYAAAQLKIVSKELLTKIDNPFSLGAKNLASNVYDRMPAVVHAELSLRYLDQDLYDTNLRFYRSVRNPLFHGKQLRHTEIESLRFAFDHIARIYEWIDYWHDPELEVRGGGKLAGVRNRYRLAKPEDSP